jgi:hypothetical protein
MNLRLTPKLSQNSLSVAQEWRSNTPGHVRFEPTLNTAITFQFSLELCSSELCHHVLNMCSVAYEKLRRNADVSYQQVITAM